MFSPRTTERARKVTGALGSAALYAGCGAAALAVIANLMYSGPRFADADVAWLAVIGGVPVTVGLLLRSLARRKARVNRMQV